MTDEKAAPDVDDARRKMNDILEKFTVDDFRRVHAKFVNSVVALELAFQRRFPAEWATYEREFYGDIT